MALLYRRLIVVSPPVSYTHLDVYKRQVMWEADTAGTIPVLSLSLSICLHQESADIMPAIFKRI